MTEENESGIKKTICDYLELKNYFPCISGQKKRTKYRSKYMRAGEPDIKAIYKGGIAMFIEVKTKKGVISDEQILFLEEIKKRGCIGFVVRSLEELIEKLESIK